MTTPYAIAFWGAMRHIPNSFVAGFPMKRDFANLMVGRGYTPNHADSSGAWILIHPLKRLVLKVGDDRPTAQFASFIAGVARRPELPRVFATTGPGAAFSIIVMERLDPFSDAQQYDAWLRQYYYSSRGAPANDPFGVVGYLKHLAGDARAHGVNLDVQGKNVLQRRGGSQLVFFDPFS